ncbi:homocysteine S-methyltransferase-like [Liolophura sinensis]|uniref:homocysteine S-methyltransferase-like n=1 Tax=Liolophura sinensis TaxID=3198878 RepID=UPI0031590B49
MLCVEDMDTTPRVLDGGLAYTVERIGNIKIDADPLWTARLLHTDPDYIISAHKSFLQAGASVILTASYQASVPGFREHLRITENEAIDLIKRSTSLARKACSDVLSQDPGNPKVLVAGSVGPYGACCHDGSEYTGKYVEYLTVQELQDWHLPRIQALVESGVDILGVETIPAQKEAEAVIGLLQTEFPNTKAYLTYSCKDGCHTCHGETFANAILPAIQSECFIGVGMNCTAPGHVTSLLRSIQHQPIKKAVIAKPNSGEQYEAGKGWYGKEKCAEVQTFVPDWLSLGATWIGGCCQVYPADIAQIRKEMSRLKTM